MEWSLLLYDQQKVYTILMESNPWYKPLHPGS